MNENDFQKEVYQREMLDITKFILINVNVHVLVYPIFACIYSKLIYYKLSVPMSRQELS